MPQNTRPPPALSSPPQGLPGAPAESGARLERLLKCDTLEAKCTPLRRLEPLEHALERELPWQLLNCHGPADRTLQVNPQ